MLMIMANGKLEKYQKKTKKIVEENVFIEQFFSNDKFLWWMDS